jgi:hypothetical protein
MKKKFLCLGNCFFLFLTFLFVLNRNTLAQHTCNQGCTGAANITCNEATGISSNRGSCISGLACYSGAGGRCRNPYCPNRTDCACPNFTIQGFKLPNQAPYSSQGVYLDGTSSTTAQPYYFYNVPANALHRVNVGVPAGSSVGYTLCYDQTGCHTNTPVMSSSLYICSNRLTSYADLWWHYTPLTPNCKNIRADNRPLPATVLNGDTVVLSADYENAAGNLTQAGMVVINGTDCNSMVFNQTTVEPVPPSTYSFNWTPSSVGTYTAYCRAWNDGVAECRGRCVDAPPRYQCSGSDGNGATTYGTITVQNPGPWYKLKNASLNKIGDHNITVVQNIKKFTDTDSDDTTIRYIIINSTGSNPGVLLVEGSYNPGPSYNPVPPSSNGLYKGNYGPYNKNTMTNFLEYIKSRKSYQTITALNNITADGIYNYSGDLTINNNLNYNIVLVVSNGNVTIANDSFNLSGGNLIKNIAIIVPNNNKKIIFTSAVQAVGGVFIADTIEYQSTNGLKVKGNLISKKPIALQSRADNARPSLFVVFDPMVYRGLLDKLSIAKYDWKKVQ